MTKTIIISLLFVLGLTVGAVAREIPLINEDFESGLGGWTLVRLVDNTLWSFPPPAYDDTPMLFPADATGVFGTNTPYAGYAYTKCGGFAGDLPAPQYDGTTATWLRLQVPNAVPPGSKVILNLELDRYVYTSSSNGTYQYCNRFFILTDSVYDDPMFGPVGGTDGIDPITLNGGGGNGSGARSSVWNHETGNSANVGGMWRHTSWTDATNKVFTSNNGHIEIRLVQYGRPGVGTYGQLTNAWDNLHIVLKDFTTKQVLWTYDESFESYSTVEEMSASWTRVLRPDEDPSRPDNDTPVSFASNDPLLYDNVNNPGSQSAGFTSPVLAYADPTRVQWLQKQLPAVVPPNTTVRMRLECDRYVYLPNVPPGSADPYGIGNRIYLLTDDEYNNPALEMGTNQAGFYDPGFRSDLWPSNPDLTFAANGVWQHFVDERDVTTTTGDFEVRLLCHDRYVQSLVQTVAWDNVRLSVVVPCNGPRFDVDGDGDVDQIDFAAIQLCYTGDGGIVGEECRCLKADADTDVDIVDLQAFEDCASGPGVSANPNCDSALPLP